MNTEYQTAYTPPAIAQVKGPVREPHLYPSFKVVLVFTSAPAMVGLLLGLFTVFVTLKAEAVLALLVYVFVAELLYGLSALIAGIIINKCRWEKNAADICKAAITCAACAALPTVLVDLDVALAMGLVAGVMGLILAAVVLPSAHSLASLALETQAANSMTPTSDQRHSD